MTRKPGSPISWRAMRNSRRCERGALPGGAYREATRGHPPRRPSLLRSRSGGKRQALHISSTQTGAQGPGGSGGHPGIPGRAIKKGQGTGGNAGSGVPQIRARPFVIDYDKAKQEARFDGKWVITTKHRLALSSSLEVQGALAGWNSSFGNQIASETRRFSSAHDTDSRHVSALPAWS